MRANKRIQLCLAAATAMMAGAAMGSGADWSTFLFDASGSRYNAAETAITPANVGQLQLKWAFVFPGADGIASSQPAMSNGLLYVGARNGLFYALDANTGQLRWSFDSSAVVGPTLNNGLPNSTTGTTQTMPNLLRDGPAVANGVVYFGDFYGFLYALDAASGRLLWATEVEPHRDAIITSSPAVYNGRVYVGISSKEVFNPSLPNYPCCQARGGVAALDAATGELLWKHYTVPPSKQLTGTFLGLPRYAPSGGPVWSSPAIDAASQTLVIGSGQNYTGTVPYDGHSECSDPVTSGCSDSVIAFDLVSGQQKWAHQMLGGDSWTAACILLPNSTLGNCSVSGPDYDVGASPNIFKLGTRSVVAVGQKSGLFHLLDLATGATIWDQRLATGNGPAGRAGENGIQWGSAWDGQSIYVATYNANPGTLYALDPTATDPARRIRWSTPNPADGCTTGGAKAAPSGTCAPSMGQAVSATPGLVFEGSRDGKFRVFGAAGGQILYTFDTVQSYSGVNGVKGQGGSIGHGGVVVSHGMVYVNSGYATSDAQHSDSGSGIRAQNAVLLAFGLPGRAP